MGRADRLLQAPVPTREGRGGSRGPEHGRHGGGIAIGGAPYLGGSACAKEPRQRAEEDHQPHGEDQIRPPPAQGSNEELGKRRGERTPQAIGRLDQGEGQATAVHGPPGASPNMERRQGG